ncbi:MAG: hypothetical protein HQM09_08555 [Candidatus Riflebacteria bacterium]|nr:hypothetical protein [Candidatus Riflebacteria bacterium]
MSEFAVFSDVMFDSESIGLAETMTALSEPVKIVIESDTEAKTGEIIYFGLSTSVGDIMETKGRVFAVTPKEGGFALTIDVLEVDAAMTAVAISCLKAGEEAASSGGGPIWGIGLKQTNNTYAVLVNAPAGLLNAAQLSKLGELAAKGAGVAKLTHAQRVILLIPLERTEEIRAELTSVGLQVGVLHKGVRNVRACCGALCRFSQNTDAIGTALAIDKALYGRGVKFDVKLAISDCMRNCSESYCSDIGLIGGNGGYRMVVGGRGSQIPFRAIQLADGIKSEDVPAAVTEVVDWYEKNAKEDERFWKLLVRMGEAEAKKHDLSAIENSMASLGDGVDELERFRDQLARMAAVRMMKKEISFCRHN